MDTPRPVVSGLLPAAQFISAEVPGPGPEEAVMKFRVDKKETWEISVKPGRKDREVFGTGQSVKSASTLDSTVAEKKKKKKKVICCLWRT